MYSIGNLCSEYKLSRSTLLYYDSIGLLVASERTRGNYRQYSEEDRKRLSQICAFREAGVPLSEIKRILDTDGISESHVLERRLNELNQEIRYLRFQQKVIVEMLKRKDLITPKMLMDKQTFVSILKLIGLDDTGMHHFHAQLEKNSPDSHQFFLEFLGIGEEEIKNIRKLSKEED
ncbi:putative transcriptional regulator [Desulfosporosinus orientis DSM 765]|uniref:Putative transcriptional regulator n=1 Tax=Desulfosporosinus orientis (strain ATCC 19365 / DSM 765 / NCIMB 8382 / VKM B-1628 / Singapore I) TaxID=768706 RepID=G7W9B6_DESOD|nr:MerR family transcriptional regulator [Desulfosporosinus orientis]AET69253.1 putative transcriptional regulator [Desulfosporosinus orientis DSM 765]